MGERDVLVLLDAARADDARREIARRLDITQVAPPRVLVVRVGERDVAELAAIPGVVRLLEQGETGDPLPGLSEGERLFARGWLAGPVARSRSADGLDWDAPGYAPPR